MLKNCFKNPLKQWNSLKLSPNFSNTIVCSARSYKINKICESVPKHNLTFSRWCSLNRRNFHTSAPNRQKIFRESENEYARKTLPKLPFPDPIETVENPIRSVEEFDSFLDQNWRKSSASEIVDAFKRVRDFVISQEITLSDSRFDQLVDGLLDNCEYLTFEEILDLLRSLAVFPRCENINSHNFHDVWSCLDDICCWHIGQFDFDRMFVLIEAWYALGMARLGDFGFEVIDRCLRRYKHLNRDQMVWLFFCLNVVRRRVVDFEFEYRLIDHLDDFTLDQLGVIAMGYFKSKSKIKLKPILQRMANKVAANSGNVNEITLAAILKILRFSQLFEVQPEIEAMLNALLREIGRLSTFSCLHIALIGSTIQYHHPATLSKSSQRIVDEIKGIRLKDIERIILANAMFNFDPKTRPDLYETSLGELRKCERLGEMAEYNRCLPCALNFLSIRKIYDYDLMSRVLADDFIGDVYGKVPKALPGEIFALDCSIDIECPDYQGNRLLPHRRYRSAKWQTEYAPTHLRHKPSNKSQHLFLDVLDHVELIAGEDCVKVDHVLPHFSRADILTCQNRVTGEFEQPMGFENYILGDIKRPFSLDVYKWFAFIVLIPNITDRITRKPLGFVQMKERQIRMIGYQPIYVDWISFPPLSRQGKLDYLMGEMSQCD